MINFRNLFLTFINRLGRVIPKRIQRLIADYPGVLLFFEKLSRGGQVEIETPEGHRLTINQLFHSNIIKTGDISGYEPEIRKSILKLTRPGMVAYDIGANVGIFSFLFSSLVGKDGIVYAFEPEKNNYICFEKSLDINKCQNIHLDKRAIGNTRGVGQFDRRGGAFSGRLIGESATYTPTNNIQQIDVINIDHLVRNEGYRLPDIMKIDVEGNEAMVLEGMKNILAEHNPVIICELHTHLGEQSENVVNMLNDFGYSLSTTSEVLSDDNSELKQHDMSKQRHIIAIK